MRLRSGLRHVRHLRHCVIRSMPNRQLDDRGDRGQWADWRETGARNSALSVCFSANWSRACISTEVLCGTAMLSWALRMFTRHSGGDKVGKNWVQNLRKRPSLLLAIFRSGGPGSWKRRLGHPSARPRGDRNGSAQASGPLGFSYSCEVYLSWPIMAVYGRFFKKTSSHPLAYVSPQRRLSNRSRRFRPATWSPLLPFRVFRVFRGSRSSPVHAPAGFGSFEESCHVVKCRITPGF